MMTQSKRMSDPLSQSFGLGIDLVDIKRFSDSIENKGEKFLEKVFTIEERKYCLKKKNSYEHFSARFAAKEAAMKALGTGWSEGISFLDIEINNNSAGLPVLQISGREKEIAAKHQIKGWKVSLSHTTDNAIAIVQAIF